MTVTERQKVALSSGSDLTETLVTVTERQKVALSSGSDLTKH